MATPSWVPPGEATQRLRSHYRELLRGRKPFTVDADEYRHNGVNALPDPLRPLVQRGLNNLRSEVDYVPSHDETSRAFFGAAEDLRIFKIPS